MIALLKSSRLFSFLPKNSEKKYFVTSVISWAQMNQAFSTSLNGKSDGFNFQSIKILTLVAKSGIL